MPPPGSGLNQPALLTYRRMAVRQPDDKAAVEAVRAKLQKASERSGGVFVHFDPKEGIWMLKVDSWA